MASKISLFVIVLYALLPYINRVDRWDTGRIDMSLLRILEMVVSRVALWVAKRGQRARKCSEVSSAEPQRHSGEGQFRKP